MYIWRRKNRRDRRNLLLSGPFVWGAPKGEYNTDAEDDMLRHEGEAQHTGYFRDRIRVVMHEYLNSVNGLAEVEHLITYLDEAARRLALLEAEEELARIKREGGKAKALDKDKVVVVPMEMKKKKNIYEIFRKYDADGGGTIDKDELRVLLTDLKVPMSDEELEELMDELDEDGGGDIGFEEFYNWFVREADRQKQKSEKGLFGFLKKANPYGNDIFQGFKRLVLEVESRNLAMDHAVWKATNESRMEYRKAHPPRWICPQPHCGEAFSTSALLEAHVKDTLGHEALDKAKEEENHRFKPIEAVLAGPHGRNILANRLLFSKELGSLESRISAAKETPFRPRLTDPGGKRKNQLLAGMLVQGSDAKAGVRPGFRQFKMSNQHRAAGRKDDQPLLQDVIAALLHCRDETIDIISAPTTSGQAEVLFVWKGFAVNSVALVGEFNGWKVEEMTPNPKTGKAGLLKLLGPGKYRYRFVIDGEDRLDEEASVIDDGPEQFRGSGSSRKRFGMGGLSNILLVINPMSQPKDEEEEQLKPFIISAAEEEEQQRMLTTRSNSTIATALTLDSLPSKGSPKSHAHHAQQQQAEPPAHVPLEDRPPPSTSYEESKIVRASDYSNNDACVVLPPPPQHELRGMSKVNLRNMCLYDDGAWAFAAFLQRNSLIKQLDLSNNSISDDGVEAISSALPTLLQLECIKLNGNSAGVDGCRYLVKHLRHKKTLKRFEMCLNNLGDDGAEVLSEGLLERNPNLKELYLDNCFIGNDGVGCISKALQHNKVLEVLSLASNRIFTDGVKHLSAVLVQNAALVELNLANNPLGADGCKIIGDSLHENDTLQRLDLSGVEILRHNNGEGINAILFMLRVNHNIRSIKLRNNALGSHPMHLLPIDIAYALTFNKGLVEFDLTGNPIAAKWFEPNKVITTHILKDMPTIRTSLDRVRKMFANPEVAARLNKLDAKAQREVHPTFDGYWTLRRKWKKVNRKAEERRALQLRGSQEEIRIALEVEHVNATVERHLLTLEAFLDNPDCRSFVLTLARLVKEHLKNLIGLQPPPPPPPEEAEDEDGDHKSINTQGSKGSKGSKQLAQPEVLKTSAAAAEEAKAKAAQAAMLQALGQDEEEEAEEERKKYSKTPDEEESKSAKARRIAAQLEAERIARLIPFDDPAFNHMHTALCRAIFGELHCDPKTLTIAPESVIEAFYALALPLSHEDAQAAVTATQVPKRPLLSFKRFLEYTKTVALSLVEKQPLTRRRMEADLFFNPPVVEAKRIILQHSEFVARREVRREYRAEKGHEPLFCCHLCHERFHSLKTFEKHMSKGVNSPEHLRLVVLDETHASQSFVLRHAKFLVTGTYFPCFFELHPVLPEDYTPQVFDSMGEGGRPIGVIEPNMTVLVEDVLGDFVQISFEGQLGWVRFRINEEEEKKKRLLALKKKDGDGHAGQKKLAPASSGGGGILSFLRRKEASRVILRSACTGVPNFSWDKLQVQSKPTFYQVRDDPQLPRRLEIKVRMQPVLDAPVVGYLKLGQVVESRALFGDWLQIKFETNDAAWVVQKVGGGTHHPAPPPMDEAVLIAQMTKRAREAREKLREELKNMNAAARRRKRAEIEKRGGMGVVVAAMLSKEDEQEDIAAGLVGADMFRILHPSVQFRLSNTVNYSPYTPRPDDLVVDLNWRPVEIGGADLMDDAEAHADDASGPADDQSEGLSKASKSHAS